MSDDVIRRLAIEQRKRLVGALMSHAEREFFDELTPRQRAEFRDKVLTSVGAYHDFMLDVLKVNRDGFLQNEYAVELIRAVHDSQARLEQVLNQ